MFKSLITDQGLKKYISEANFASSSVIMKEMYIKAINDSKPNYNSPISQLLLLKMLVLIAAPKKILELGVFRGLSILAIGEGCDTRNSQIIACDVTDEYLKNYKQYWIEAGINGIIDLKIEKASIVLDSLHKSAETIDFSYLDANKSEYLSYYEKLVELTIPGGLIVIDNVLWKGDVANDNIQDNFTNIMRKLNKNIKNDNRVDSVLIAIEDGLWIVRKKICDSKT